MKELIEALEYVFGESQVIVLDSEENQVESTETTDKSSEEEQTKDK